MCEISIIIILICQKYGLVGPVEQKIKLLRLNIICSVLEFTNILCFEKNFEFFSSLDIKNN